MTARRVTAGVVGIRPGLAIEGSCREIVLWQISNDLVRE
jgi:hypothetical protein